MFYAALAASLAGPIAALYAVFAVTRWAGSRAAAYVGLAVEAAAAVVGVYLIGLAVEPERLVEGTRWLYLYYTTGIALLIGGVRFSLRCLKLRR